MRNIHIVHITVNTLSFINSQLKKEPRSSQTRELLRLYKENNHPKWIKSPLTRSDPSLPVMTVNLIVSDTLSLM